MTLRLVSWNIGKRSAAWDHLLSDPSLDLALLQEVKPPPEHVACDLTPRRDEDVWTMPGYEHPFRTAIARLSNRVSLRPRPTAPLGTAARDVFAVSMPGTLTVADVEHDGETFTCVSAYAPWQYVLGASKSGWIIADASVHRLLSDVSTLIASQTGHRLIVAGDFNVLRGHGEDGSPYWARRYQTIFDRCDALGLAFIGPQVPNGRQASPWPAELPKDSKNVPTFHSSSQSPATASRQLDFVFASKSIADRVRVRALNEVEEWGPSDHCRVSIEIEKSG